MRMIPSVPAQDQRRQCATPKAFTSSSMIQDVIAVGTCSGTSESVLSLGRTVCQVDLRTQVDQLSVRLKMATVEVQVWESSRGACLALCCHVGYANVATWVWVVGFGCWLVQRRLHQHVVPFHVHPSANAWPPQLAKVLSFLQRSSTTSLP